MSALKTKSWKNIATYSLLVILFQLSCKEKGIEIVDDFCDGPIGLWEFLGLEGETIHAIAVDPTDPSVLYTGGSGELFKSIDCGKTWDTLRVGGYYSAIAIDPHNTQTIYAISGTVIKSTDGGLTWQQITNGIFMDLESRAYSLAIDQVNSNTLYVGIAGLFAGSFFKSTNAGQSWQDAWSGDSLGDGAISIAIDPQNTSTIYVGTAVRGLLVKSTDAGETWVRTGLGETGRLVESVAIHPQNSDIVYAGVRSQGLMVSLDGGTIWQKESIPDSVGSVRGLVFNFDDPSDIYAATNHGCFNKACAACDWVEKNEGMIPLYAFNVITQGKDGRLYAGKSANENETGGGVYARRN